MKLHLYHYWRSSSSWRVRWALMLKNIPFEETAVNLLSDEPEHPTHLKRNPTGYVPVLEVSGALPEPWFLGESVAMIEWINETYPNPPLLSKDPFLRARTRQLAEVINSGTQPLQNPTVASFYSEDSNQQKKWNQHWIRRGLAAYETLTKDTAGILSVGDSVSFADLFLIPQCYSANRFEVSLSDFPIIDRIYQNALKLESCQKSSPERYKAESKIL